MSDLIPPTPKIKAPFMRLSLGNPSEETVGAFPQLPERDVGAIEERQGEEEEEPESPTKLKMDGLTPERSPNALDSSFRELNGGKRVSYSTTGPATGIGGEYRSPRQQLPEPSSSSAGPARSQEMRSKVNRNIFNPLTTPERGGNLMQGPRSPPYVDKTSNQTKLASEFQLSKTLGAGSYGEVSKYIGKLDGIAYAIKKTREQGGSFGFALREIYALSALCGHPHIIRYCGSWVDGSYLLIQTELGNGGSLEDVFLANLKTGSKMDEGEQKQVLLHIGSGLKFMHSQGIVHNDLKPPNIFINYNHSGKFQRPDPDSASLRDIFEDARILGGYPDGPFSAEECERNNLPIYKIGDLGVANFSNKGADDYNPEGDIRYFARRDGGYRTHADVFGLGLAVFELGSGIEIPADDDDSLWFKFRDGDYFGNDGMSYDYHQRLAHCSLPFRKLLLEVLQADEKRRISAAGLVSHVLLNPAARKLGQLRADLTMAKMEFEMKRRMLPSGGNY